MSTYTHTHVHRTTQNTPYTPTCLKRYLHFYIILCSICVPFMAGLRVQDGFINSVRTLSSIYALCLHLTTSKHSKMLTQSNLQSRLLYLHHSRHGRHTHTETTNGLMFMPISTFISGILLSVKNKSSFPQPVSKEIWIVKELKQMSWPKEN